MIEQESFTRCSRIENQRDAVITRLPWIGEKRPAGCFKMRNVCVTQKIKSVSQRLSPFLIPSRFASSLTTAIANPATDSMSATPGSTFAFGAIINFYFEFRRMLCEELAVVCDRESARWCFFRQSMRQTNVAEFEVMTIGFTIRGEVEHLLAVRGLRKGIDKFATGT